TDGIYADPLEEPIAESLKKTTGTTRRDLAHRFRNKMKPLEMAVRDAKWHDSAASERITKTIRSGEFILQSKHAL
ncbi:MAG: hypothetical protein J2P49_05265, partial [Methylocapsa sp.]|nr:hypothetical protein [Methylocapsa sp.]